MFGRNNKPKDSNNAPDEHIENTPAEIDNCPEESPIEDFDFGFGLALDGVQALYELIESTKKELSCQHQKIAGDNQELTKRLQDYLKIVAECQKETAKLANNTVERYALHPAIEALDLMTFQIVELRREANSLAGAGAHCPLVESLFDSITNIAKLAQTKREHLDMQAICPQHLDELDPEKHDIRQVVETDDAGKHRKIEKTITPGLIYHGKVLRQARVSVYRHIKKQ